MKRWSGFFFWLILPVIHSLIHSIIHSYNKHILSVYYAPALTELTGYLLGMEVGRQEKHRGLTVSRTGWQRHNLGSPDSAVSSPSVHLLPSQPPRIMPALHSHSPPGRLSGLSQASRIYPVPEPPCTLDGPGAGLTLPWPSLKGPYVRLSCPPH